MGLRAAHSSPSVMPASAPGRKAGCSASAQCQAGVKRNGITVICPRTLPGTAWWTWPTSRWPIEQFYEDAKGECGLDHDRGHRWDWLHRHLAPVMLVYSFLACQRWTPADGRTAAYEISGRREGCPCHSLQLNFLGGLIFTSDFLSSHQPR